MKEKYVSVRSEEMKMMVEYRKKSKAYKVLNPIFWGCWILGVSFVLGATAVSCYYYDTPFSWTGLIMIFLITFTVMLIPMIFISVARIGPGRDLFNARLGESIFLDEEAFKDEWSPRVSPDKAKYMGYKIAYKDMTRIDYDPEFKRLEIYGKRMVFKDFGHEMRTIREDDGKPFLVYGYFENMDQLKESLARRSGLTIRNLEFGSAKACYVAANRADAR
mgnify:FL=1